ncbi:hypothetical protein AX15_004304 [Amanita polypyramis BW_CC]|nr:hypothetical protein AX15_004304 [Amanita polypyramis BW_CC]
MPLCHREGMYLIVAPQAFLVLRQKQLNRGLMTYLYSTTIVISVLMTIHLVVDLARAFIGFTAHTDVPNAPEVYYAQENVTLSFIKSSTVIATTLVADILLIYRTLVLWGHRWWVSVFLITLFGLDVAASVWFTWSLSKGQNNYNIVDTAAFARSTCFFTATLAVNLICTCLIAYRIWTVQNGVARYTSINHRIQNVLLIILESAAIYTVDLIGMIVSARLHSAVLFVFLTFMPPLIGLVFTFVVLRTSDTDRCDTGRASLEVRSNNMLRFAVSNEVSDAESSGPSSEGVRIHVEKIVHGAELM